MVGRNVVKTCSFSEALCQKGYRFAEINVYRITNINVGNRAYTKNRALYEIYDDHLKEALTLNHLLFGRRLESTNFNDSNSNPDAPSIPCRYKHFNKILNHFWKR